MGTMATWEDGPEYAPLERPAEFAVPPGPVLEDAAPVERSAASAPPERPAFDLPPTPVTPLHQLVPPVADSRDPAEPFAVASSTLTSTGSAWDAAHWSRPNGPTAGIGGPVTTTAAGLPGTPAMAYPPQGQPFPAAQAAWPPPGQSSYPPPWEQGPDRSWPPTDPMHPASNLAQQQPTGFPVPGTPQWFGPGPAPVQQSPAVVGHDTRAVLEAATPGLCICLGIGGLLYPFAPLMVVVAFFLRTRVKVAQVQVRQAFAVALVFLAFMALIGFLLNGTSPDDWWGFFGASALVTCWGLLATVLILVHRALKRRAGVARPSYPTEWR